MMAEVERRNISLLHLGEQSGVDRWTITRWREGGTVNLDKLEYVLQVLGYKVTIEGQVVEQKPYNYVVLTASGRVWNTKASMAYHNILDAINNEQMSAGSNWDRPTQLIHNGVVVISSNLADIAWKYSAEFRDARFAAADAVNARFPASWET